MNLPAYEYPRNALVDFKPIGDAIDANRDYAIKQEGNAIKREHLALEKQNSERSWAQLERKRQADEAKRIGQIMSVIDAEENPQRRQLLWRGAQSANRAMFDHAASNFGLDANDHINGPKFFMAQADLFDPMKRKVQEAQIAAQNASAMSNRAHAGYYQAATEAAKAKAAPTPAPSPTQAESLDSYNIDAAGNLVRPTEIGRAHV